MAPVSKTKEKTKKKGNGTKLAYSEESMLSAITAVRDGKMKIRKSAREHGVPHSTLINKLKGRVPEKRKMGPSTYLTVEEENLLSKYIIANANKGIPLRMQTLQDTVKKIIDDDQRSTPFKLNRPGRKWTELFMKRHPELTERNAEGISTSRAKVTESDLRAWFAELKSYLISEGVEDILEDSSRIYNADESGFRTCPESGKVLGPVGMKNFYEVKSGQEKEQITVMVNISASGEIVPPMIVYPLVRISKDISGNVPSNWAIGKSKSGWMTSPLYYEYIANIFSPWLTTNNIKRPVLLLIDGHRSHMTLQVSQWCEENQILAYAFYPNSTHITQPADVSVFKSLKSGWKNTVYDYKRSTGNRMITRAGFAPLLAKVIQEKVTPNVIKNGFERCGVYPFNPSAVDYTKCMENEARKIMPVPSDRGVEIILLVESMMRRGRAEQFRNSEENDWQGDESAKELFYVWKKLRQRFITQSPTKSLHATETNETTTTSATPYLAVSQPSVSGEFQDLLQETNTNPTIPTQTASSSSTCDQSPLRTSLSSSIHALVDEQHTESLSSSSNQAATDKEKSILTVKKQQQLSPAFGKHILWPSDSPIKTFRAKERLPFATTSKKWQDYWVIKEEEKKKKDNAKEDRKRKRQLKKDSSKQKKTANTRKVMSESSESENNSRPSSDSEKTDSDIENYSENPNDSQDVTRKTNSEVVEGDYAIVAFSSEKRIFHFLCVVQKTYNDGELEVMAMKSCSPDNTTFKADENDVSMIKKNQIKRRVSNPKIIVKGDRIQYKFPVPLEVGLQR